MLYFRTQSTPCAFNVLSSYCMCVAYEYVFLCYVSLCCCRMRACSMEQRGTNTRIVDLSLFFHVSNLLYSIYCTLETPLSPKSVGTNSNNGGKKRRIWNFVKRREWSNRNSAQAVTMTWHKCSDSLGTFSFFAIRYYSRTLNSTDDVLVNCMIGMMRTCRHADMMPLHASCGAFKYFSHIIINTFIRKSNIKTILNHDDLL